MTFTLGHLSVSRSVFGGHSCVYCLKPLIEMHSRNLSTLVRYGSFLSVSLNKVGQMDLSTLWENVMLAVLTQGKWTNGSISLLPHVLADSRALRWKGGLCCPVVQQVGMAVSCVYLAFLSIPLKVACSCLSLLSMLRSSDTGNFPWFLLFLPSFFICGSIFCCCCC